MNLLQLIDAGTWNRAVFTTYSLGLSYFEAVILDALTRKKCSEIVIFSDIFGYMSSMKETGVIEAGRQYALEPIHIPNYAFHPKICFLEGKDECHVLIGSGNLTFSGQGGNIEVIEHLHSEFAPEAMNEVGEFFKHLTTLNGISENAKNIAENISSTLTQKLYELSDRPNIVVLFNKEKENIAEQLVNLTKELGEVSEIKIISPFFDNDGVGIQILAEMLNCKNIKLHVQNESAASKNDLMWPWDTHFPLQPVKINSPLVPLDNRSLHSKIFEICCEKGKIVVSGSANATRAALFGGNIELCVARIDRKKTIPWSSKSTNKPIRAAIEAKPNNVTLVEDHYALYAELRGKVIQGRIYTSGEKNCSFHADIGNRLITLGHQNVNADGGFRFSIEDTALLTFASSAVTITCTGSNWKAKGYLNCADLHRIVRNSGSIGAFLKAIAMGHETAQDIALLLQFILNEFRADITSPVQTNNKNRITIRSDTLITAEMLFGANYLESQDHSNGSSHLVALETLIHQVFKRFREAKKVGFEAKGRNPNDEGEYQSANSETNNDDLGLEIVAPLELVTELIELLGKNPRHSIRALLLINYLCASYDKNINYLSKWLRAVVPNLPQSIDKDDKEHSLIAVVIHYLLRHDRKLSPCLCKATLQEKGLLDEEINPVWGKFTGFSWLEISDAVVEEYYQEALNSVTPIEQIKMFKEMRENGVSADKLPIIIHDKEISASLKSKTQVHFVKSLVSACPKHFKSLGTEGVSALKNRKICKSKYCGCIIALDEH